MRATKIRRRSRMFRRRHVGRTIAKVCAWLLVIPAVIGGYFLAKHLFTKTPVSRGEEDVPAVVTTTEPTAAPTRPEEPTPEKEPEDTALKDLRGFWLPGALLSDVSRYEATLTAATEAGYNTVVVDLKDADGKLWYASATELAEQARAVKEGALTVEELTAVAKTLKETYHLTLIPRLYAFRDNTAPRYLDTARVSVKGSPRTVWYDNDPSAGGRRWLNPYAADARRYIVELAAELKAAGFSRILLDGVQFPNQESSAYYGDASVTAVPREEVLAGFVSQLNEALGKNGWLLTATALAAVGEKTTAYGGNPVTYGAPAVAPWVMPGEMGGSLTVGEEKVKQPAAHPYEAVSLLLSQLHSRLQLMENAPTAVPWLQAGGLSAEAVATEQKALRETFGEGAPYLLYSAKGVYDFGPSDNV